MEPLGWRSLNGAFGNCSLHGAFQMGSFNPAQVHVLSAANLPSRDLSGSYSDAAQDPKPPAQQPGSLQSPQMS